MFEVLRLTDLDLGKRCEQTIRVFAGGCFFLPRAPEQSLSRKATQYPARFRGIYHLDRIFESPDETRNE